MGRIKSMLTAICVATLFTATIASAQGILPDRKTIVTFSGPVSLPGTTLPAGTYVFRIADSPANRNIVQIFDRDDAKLITTLLAVAAQRDRAEGDPVVSFKETPSDRPPAVRYWYYAGEKDGNEFVYPKAQAMMIARASGESVSAFDTDSNDLEAWKKGTVTKVTPSTATSTSTTSTTTTTASTSTTTEPPAPIPAPTATTTTTTTTAPVTTTEPEPKPAPVTAPVTAEPAPVTAEPKPMAPPAPVTAAPSIAQSQPEEPVGTSGRTLPRTASELPLVGLIGLLALAGAFGVRALRRSIA
jgi:hypothetical protein